MNPSPDPTRSLPHSSVDETLRLIASLPAPEGLSDRIHAALQTAPRRATVLHWPALINPHGSLLRGAAAAAIVCVVAGGGWQIYSRVPAPGASKGMQVQQTPAASGGFGAAGARRVPDTLNGPVLTRRPSAQATPGVGDTTQAQPVKAIAPGKPTGKTRRHTAPAVSAVPVR